MIDVDATKRFLDEGLERYAEARDAVDAFEGEIKQQLLRVMEEKDDWKNFVIRGEPRSRNKGAWADTWKHPINGQTIFAYQPGADKYSVVLGLWWRSPRAPASVLLYSSCWRGSSIQEIVIDAPRSPIECGPLDGTKSKLFRLFDATLDLGTVGRMMLDEMDRALGQMKLR